MKNTDKTIALFMLVALVLTLSCTNNPFYKDQEITIKDYFAGRVELRDGLRPDSVWVWMETLDLLAKTDSLGFFEMRLPITGQETDQLLTGSFMIYFYLSNYAPDSAIVFIRDGFVEWGKGSVNSDGEIFTTIRMRPRLSIQLNLSPPKIAEDFEGQIRGNLILTSTFEPVSLTVYNLFQTTITDWVMDRIPPSSEYPRLLYRLGTRGIDAVQYLADDDPVRLSLVIDWPPVMDRVIRSYPAGIYHIVPQIRISDVGLPEGMRRRLAPYNAEFNTDYVSYPLKIDGGELIVK